MDIEDSWDETKHERDKDGKFKGSGKSRDKSEIDKKIESINIDWSKDNTLPNLNKGTLEEFGLEDKPVLLKKTIIEKNKASHPDITKEDAKIIIGNSLYKPEAVLKANKDKPSYHNFITRLDDDKNNIVLLELSDEKENYEIVNYHYISNSGVDRKSKIDRQIKS